MGDATDDEAPEAWRRFMADHEEHSRKLDAYAAALGELVIRFGRLELALAGAVQAAFGASQDEQAAAAIDAVLSFRHKLDLIGALAPVRITEADALAEAQMFLTRLAEVEAKRNAYLHAAWGRDGDTTGVARNKTRTDRRRGVSWRRDRPSVAEIEGVAAEAERLSSVLGVTTVYHLADLLRGRNWPSSPQRAGLRGPTFPPLAGAPEGTAGGGA